MAVCLRPSLHPMVASDSRAYQGGRRRTDGYMNAGDMRPV